MSSNLSHIIAAALVLALVLEGSSSSQAQLTSDFYDSTCPHAFSIIQSVIEDTLKSDIRAPARLVRLHFHDCFVDGCDGSNLLDNSETIVSEKESLANNNSLTGFDIVDRMKAALECACPGIVSCADILAIAAERSVALSGGPSWRVQLGRRDSRTANRSHADASLPSQFGTLDALKATFRKAGLNGHVDLVALSGAHTFGRAECRAFSPRLYTFNNTNKPDSTVNPTLLPKLRRLCPKGGNGSVLTNLDLTTPNTFDNKFFTNLLANRGLLQSDQELFSTPGADTIKLVNKFARNQSAFFESFVESILRMGNLRVLTGTQGEIRLNCRRVNEDISTRSSYGGLRSSI